LSSATYPNLEDDFFPAKSARPPEAIFEERFASLSSISFWTGSRRNSDSISGSADNLFFSQSVQK
jgi:hypothetical protein